MKYTEIYLTKKYVTKEEWLNLINTISKYNGILRRWKIIITNDKNKIRYFLKTRCNVPITINNLNSFLLKPVEKVSIPKQKYTLFSFLQVHDLIDLINYYEVKNKGIVNTVEIKFMKLFIDKIKARMRFYINKKNIIKKYIPLFLDPFNILSIDFDGNKRFFYKGAPKYLDINKILHLLNTDSSNSLFNIDTFPYLQGDFYLNQNNYSFDKHSIVVGSSGTGKSKFICSLINNICKNETMKRKYKVVMIDPHASMENDIGGLGKVIDFKNESDSIDLFINKSDDDIISEAESLLELLKSLIADQYNSKLERVLRHSIHLLLINQSFNFKSLRKLILDTEYRSDLINKHKFNLPSSVIDFFLSDYNDLKTKSYGEAISPIISFIDEMDLIPAFDYSLDLNNLKDTIHDNFLTIFSLDRTKLGDKVTKTIAGLVMKQLLNIIEKREIDEHIIFVIDEASSVESPILSKYLSEARKFGLSLILATQYFNQITDKLKNSIFANVVNYYIFRVSKLDAGVLVDNFNMSIPLDNSREQKIKLLTELKIRECVARIDTNGVLLPAFKATTLDFESIPRVTKKFVKTAQNEKKASYKTNFKIGNNVCLKDILITNSTKRGV